jgi:hypothetical protein
MTKYAPPAPPDGFANWLDYAVHTCDLRGARLARMFEDDYDPGGMPPREALIAELRELRRLAGVPDTYPPDAD